MQRRCCWPPDMPKALVLRRSLTSSQSAAWRSACSTRLVEVLLAAEHARAEGDVVVDRLGERVGLLEDHPDPLAHLHRVHARGVEVLAVVEHPSLHPRARDQVVHPVEAADQGGLAAARGPDQRGDLVLARRRRRRRGRRASARSSPARPRAGRSPARGAFGSTAASSGTPEPARPGREGPRRGSDGRGLLLLVLGLGHPLRHWSSPTTFARSDCGARSRRCS